MKNITQEKKDEEFEIICDLCGKSCFTDYGNEYMELSANWGYMSGKDLETWKAHLCEQCVDEKLSFIPFQKKLHTF